VSATPLARACWFFSAPEYAFMSAIDTPHRPRRMTSAILPWIQPKISAALFFAHRLMRPMMRPQKPLLSGSGRSTAAFWPAASLPSFCLSLALPDSVSPVPAALELASVAWPAALVSALWVAASALRFSAYSSYLP
jgi:hypothetical protein